MSIPYIPPPTAPPPNDDVLTWVWWLIAVIALLTFTLALAKFWRAARSGEFAFGCYPRDPKPTAPTGPKQYISTLPGTTIGLKQALDRQPDLLPEDRQWFAQQAHTAGIDIGGMK